MNFIIFTADDIRGLAEDPDLRDQPVPAQEIHRVADMMEPGVSYLQLENPGGLDQIVYVPIQPDGVQLDPVGFQMADDGNYYAARFEPNHTRLFPDDISIPDEHMNNLIEQLLGEKA